MEIDVEKGSNIKRENNEYFRKALHIYIYIYLQSWSELLAPLANMIKEVCENSSALFILLIFYKNSQKCNLSLDNKNKNLKWG